MKSGEAMATGNPNKVKSIKPVYPIVPGLNSYSFQHKDDRLSPAWDRFTDFIAQLIFEQKLKEIGREVNLKIMQGENDEKGK